MVWQTDTSISRKSWGYIEGDDFKTTDSLVDDLIDIVSKNGCLLLNIGPRADGTIPEEAKRILLEMGAWLKTNGDAIYGTRPWKKFGEGPTKENEGHMSERKGQVKYTARDLRFVTKKDVIYAFALDWPEGELKVASLGKNAGLESRAVASVKMLGPAALLKFNQGTDALVISMPAQKSGNFAYAFEIRFR